MAYILSWACGMADTLTQAYDLTDVTGWDGDTGRCRSLSLLHQPLHHLGLCLGRYNRLMG